MVSECIILQCPQYLFGVCRPRFNGDALRDYRLERGLDGSSKLSEPAHRREACPLKQCPSISVGVEAVGAHELVASAM